MTDPILMAAARGARVQVTYGGKWYTSPLHEALANPLIGNRIHPDDEHVRFGSISSALREIAATGKDPYTLSSLLALSTYLYESPGPCNDKLHRELFLLILSEALAEDGL